MIDDELRVWLLECNRSPDLMPTTSITRHLTNKMFTDLASLIGDYDYRELNFNDNITNIGLFKKHLNYNS